MLSAEPVPMIPFASFTAVASTETTRVCVSVHIPPAKDRLALVASLLIVTIPAVGSVVHVPLRVKSLVVKGIIAALKVAIMVVGVGLINPASGRRLDKVVVGTSAAKVFWEEVLYTALFFAEFVTSKEK